jgi:hypothetical protein
MVACSGASLVFFGIVAVLLQLTRELQLFGDMGTSISDGSLYVGVELALIGAVLELASLLSLRLWRPRESEREIS